MQTRSHHCVQETTIKNNGTCFSHQRGEFICGAYKTAVTKEEDCNEDISMACASVVRILHATQLCGRRNIENC